jgi:hypothetical protein
VLAIDPEHPGIAHYIIHACDNPNMAQEGLPVARRYARIAPSSPHALHMPSHIFARLGLWQDGISSNLASVAAAEHSPSGTEARLPGRRSKRKLRPATVNRELACGKAMYNCAIRSGLNPAEPVQQSEVSDRK